MILEAISVASFKNELKYVDQAAQKFQNIVCPLSLSSAFLCFEDKQ